MLFKLLADSVAFIHLLSPLLYPASLERGTQVVLGLALLAIDAVAYSLVWRRRARSRR